MIPHVFLPSDASMRTLAWTLLLVMWQTSLFALVVRGVFHLSGRPKATRRHAVAWATLWVAVALAAASFWALRHPLASRATVQPLAARVTTVSGMLAAFPTLVGPSTPASHDQAVERHDALHLLPWVAWLWLAVALALAGRALGGWLLTRRIQRRASLVTNHEAVAAFAAVRTEMRLRRPVRLLESADIDAPVTMGWTEPAILFPSDLVEELPLLAFRALAAHELGHVKRRDYVATLAQVVPDTLFFFCPGARWLSARVREAREQCCDDMAVAACGSASLYASALGAVAERGYCLGVGALGATTPRLVDRIRRLSEGDPMLRLGRARSWALAVASLILALLAAGTGAASFLDTAASSAAPRGRDLVPTGYVPQQPGAPITISGRTSTAAYLFDSVRIRNAAEVSISSVTFVAGIRGGDRRKPIVLLATDPIAVTLEPGASTELHTRLLPPSQALAAREGFATRDLTVTLGVLRVGFADGSEWRVLPQTSASTFDEAFYLPKGGVAGRRVEKGESRGNDTGDQICADDLGLRYSAGGIVAVTDEPGALARCMHGRWVAYSLGAPKK